MKFAWRLREHQQGPGDVWLMWDGGGHFYNAPNQIAIEKTFLLEHLLGPTSRPDAPAPPRADHGDVGRSSSDPSVADTA